MVPGVFLNILNNFPSSMDDTLLLDVLNNAYLQYVQYDYA